MQQTAPSPATTSLRCRPITEADLDAVVALLLKGFWDRSEQYWRDGLARHVARRLPEGYPVYGFLMEAGGSVVGVLLTLYQCVEQDGETQVRCNLSSWYVEPEFRTQAPLLDNLAVRRKNVTYMNVSPAPHTWAMLEARGFVRYCRGQMLAIPALAPARGIRTRRVTASDDLADLPPEERSLVADHLRYGCVCLVCTDAQGSRPFIFMRRKIGLSQRRVGGGQIPCLQLFYCRTTDDLARFAGSIGRHLLWHHGIPWIIVDADAALPGLVGRFFPGRAPKYAKGPGRVRLGDLAYTEMALFGP